MAAVATGAGCAGWAENIINVEELNGIDGFAVLGPTGIGFGHTVGECGRPQR